MSEDMPRRPESDDDAWAQIIAGFEDDSTGPVAPWPIAEDIDETDDGAGETGTVDDETYDTFVPPDPPPLPRLDTIGQFAWGGLIGGPMFLILAAVFDWRMPPLFLALAVTAFVAGFVTLVVRMNDGRPDDWDNDSGAVL